MTQKELYTVWIKEGEAALAAKKAGVIKESYKVLGAKQVVAIVDVPSNHDIDTIFFTPHRGQIRCTPTVCLSAAYIP